MNSLVPVFTKKVVNFATPWITIGSGSHMWFNTAGTITSDPTNVPATAIHGPFQLDYNGGADVVEVHGYFLLGSTSGTGCSECMIRASVWGESKGQVAHRDMTSVSTLPTISTAVTPAVHSKQVQSMIPMRVSGSYNGGTTNRGRSSSGDAVFATSMVDSFPLVADGTNPTAGDITQFSFWILGPGADAFSSQTIAGSPLSLGVISRIWFAMKFIPALTGGVSTPVVFGGIGLTGYRAVNRADPKEHNIMGTKPFGPTTSEWV